MDRLYMMPIAGAGTKTDPRGPKYRDDFGSMGWNMMDFGRESQALVIVKDITAPAHAVLSAYSDVLVINEDLDQSVTAQEASDIKAYLSSIKIPEDWITPSNTWREILRSVIGVMQLNQRYNGLTGGGSIFDSGAGLNTQFRNLGTAKQANLVEAANTLGLDVSVIGANDQLRKIVRELGDEFSLRPLSFGGAVI